MATSGNDTDLLTEVPYVRIVEQPVKFTRFRYLSERRTTSALKGNNGLRGKYPGIEIVGWNGEGSAKVIVSCVTTTPLTTRKGKLVYKPHPHNLVGRNCKFGVCNKQITTKTYFPQISIQCVKRNEIYSSLEERKKIGVDPFNCGFDWDKNCSLKTVRLCFQVYIETPTNGLQKLTPVVSRAIIDKQHVVGLNIVRLSDCVAPADGNGKELILLCDRVDRKNIEIRFYEEKDGDLVWEDYGVFDQSQVYKQHGIWFKPPRYKQTDLEEPVNVWIQLKRPSDDSLGIPLPFQFIPCVDLNSKRKRKKLDRNKILMDLKLLSTDYTIPSTSVQKEQLPVIHWNVPSTSEQVLEAPRSIIPEIMNWNIPTTTKVEEESLSSTLPPTSHIDETPNNILSELINWNIPTTSRIEEECLTFPSSIFNTEKEHNTQIMDWNIPSTIEEEGSLNLNSDEILELVSTFDVMNVTYLPEMKNFSLPV